MYILLIAIVGGFFGWYYSSWVHPLLEKDPNKLYPIEIHLGAAYCISLMLIDLLFEKLTMGSGTVNIILPFALIATLRWLYKKFWVK